MKKLKLTAWIAKDLSLNQRTYLYIAKPYRNCGVFTPPSGDKCECFPLEENVEPQDLTWENSPREVELTIKEKRRGWFR